jgi:hypothetical protein
MQLILFVIDSIGLTEIASDQTAKDRWYCYQLGKNNNKPLTKDTLPTFWDTLCDAVIQRIT